MIRLFKEDDMELVYEIVLKYWSSELDIPGSKKNELYHMLSKYYYKNKEYSFVLGDVDAFIFASFKDDKPLLDVDTDNTLVNDYKNYLEYNNNKVKGYMTVNSLNVGLVASVVPSGGQRLLKHIEEIARNTKRDYIYLWTDETCNYSYYEHLGYVLVEEYVSKMIDRNVKTYIYRLEIK